MRDEDTIVLDYDHSSINDDNETIAANPFHLMPSTNNNFACANIVFDHGCDSESTKPHDDLDSRPQASRPPPKPPPTVILEICFSSTSPMLQKLRTNHHASFAIMPFSCMTCAPLHSNASHSCNYIMEAK